MKLPQRWLPLAILTLSMAGLVACTKNEGSTVTTTSETTGVTVSGHGEATGTPDTAFFDIAVQVKRNTVGEARDAAARDRKSVV